MKKNKKIFKFNELMTPDMYIELGLDKLQKNINDKDYFFNYKEVNKLWDEDIIKIYIYNISFDKIYLIFKSRITIYDKDFYIYILVDYDQNVEFGSERGFKYIYSFEESIESELEYFKDMFLDIYDELIPYDFWDVMGKVN